jgi:ferric-dicitrate binding protein FerR (iron transport regulator)
LKDNFEYIDELIAKVLANEATAEEKLWLENWGNESAQNKAYVEDSEKLLTQIDSVKIDKKVDTDAAWSKVNIRIENGDTKIIELPRRKRTFQIAAAVILLVCMSFFLKMLLSKNSDLETYAATEQMLEKKLPDGSTVFMNRNTEVSYSVNKNNVREVKLKGEAYFEVVHNESQPFVINAGGVLVKDIGTEFNVKALPETGMVEVKVESGEVQFYTENSEGLKLVKGEKAQYNKATKKFNKINVDAFDNTSSYRSKIFNFRETKLQDAIDQLNDIYLCDIVLSDMKLANCPLTVTFENKPISEIIDIMAETLGFTVQRNGNTYILTGGECPKM